jgi:hypothetical protein
LIQHSLQPFAGFLREVSWRIRFDLFGITSKERPDQEELLLVSGAPFTDEEMQPNGNPLFE